MTWIDVNDRLPEYDKLVFCRGYKIEFGKTEIIYFVGKYLKEQKNWFGNTVKAQFSPDISIIIDEDQPLPFIWFTVTHWMPIPEI